MQDAGCLGGLRRDFQGSSAGFPGRVPVTWLSWSTSQTLSYYSVLPFSKDTTGLGEERGCKTVRLCFNVFKNIRWSDEVNEVCFSLERDPSSYPDPLLTVAK